MPELPEVETIRRGLSEVFLGKSIKAVAINRYDLRRPIPKTFAALLTGRQIRAIDRRGKYLLLRLDDDSVIIIHLGMSGRMVIGGAEELGRHDHVVFYFADGQEIRFNDPRRFGSMDITTVSRLSSHPVIRGLGIEPLTPEFTEKWLAQRLYNRRAPIKNLLMDQTIIAGLGNIYVCESLFQAGISPRRSGSNVKGVRLKRLVRSIREVLTLAIEAGGSSLRDYVQTSGELGYFQHSFSVYNREGQPCINGQSGHLVSRLVQANRSTFYCSLCQR